ncbi:MAG: hypothetical protein HRU03_08450 [Nanoarchaeales archaeon]|nr:hypothetical protein [Nanoarchaeales archaeon]
MISNSIKNQTSNQKKKYSLFFILIVLNLFLVGCTNSTSSDFMEDTKNFNLCSLNVIPQGKCIKEQIGYEFDIETNSCNEVTVLGCDAVSPFESMIECQNSCFKSSNTK